jgi:uncharacterized membrane protein HdeD (DUF308 family)
MAIEVKTSIGWRALEIVAGLVVIVLAAFVLADPSFATLTLTVLIAGALIIGGFSRIVLGLFATGFPARMRQLNVTGGIVAVLLGILGLVFLQGAIGSLILALALAILVVGAIEIGVAVSRHPPTWIRALIAVVGALTVVLAIVVVINPTIGQNILAAILAAALVLVGIRDIVHGVTGHKPVQLPPSVPVTEL